MYRHNIDDMVKSVMEELGYDSSKINEEIKIREALERVWEKKIAIVWSVRDILDRAKDQEKELTEEQALDILNELLYHHNASIGISWDVIDANLP